jgi:hypothetical protein
MDPLKLLCAGVGIFMLLPLVCFICAKMVTLGYLKTKRDFNKE